MFKKFWHKTLRRPFALARTIEEGTGHTVVLLHGLGRSRRVWQHVVEQLEKLPADLQIVAFDLLGFGDSPKPSFVKYDVDDHARAVIASLEKLRAGEPVILVGHSMGCLVAVRVARLRPDLVRHLVLYEMPLYKGLPQNLHYRVRLEIYKRVYEKIIAYQPSFDQQAARRAEKLAQKITGFEVTPESWLPFARSLEHTIMNQTTAEDIKQLVMPMDVIYGSMDMLVIRGKEQALFGNDLPNLTMHTVRARHTISVKASKFIAERVIAALKRDNVV